jgi:hypothetical protein
VVADDHGLPDPVIGREPTGGVGEDHRLHPCRGGGADAVDDRLDTAALVEVGAAQEEQHLPVAHLHRAHLAAVPDGGRGGEPGQFPDGDAALGGAERVRGGGPAGAHHHRDVVRSAERRGEGVGGLRGKGGGVGSGGLVHAGTLTQALSGRAGRPYPRPRGAAEAAVRSDWRR